MQELIQIFCATLGTLGFALLFRVRREHLLFATLGGALSWTAYLAVGFAGAGVFLSSLTGGVAVCLWSEMMARWRKAPANVYLIPGIVPLLPGSALYYAMEAVVNEDTEVFTAKGIEALLGAVGIAGGILIASEIVRCFLVAARFRRRKQQEKEAAIAAALAEAEAREKAEKIREKAS